MNTIQQNQKPSATIEALAPNEMVSEWLSTDEFAKLAGLVDRTARRALVACLSGGTWRGNALQVRHEGKALRVYAPSLPADLRDIWHERYQACRVIKSSEPVMLPSPDRYSARIADDYALLQWKLELLSAALQYPKGSKERGNALREITSKEAIKPNGKPYTPTLSTLQGWLKSVEENGVQALQRKHCKESAPRVCIS